MMDRLLRPVGMAMAVVALIGFWVLDDLHGQADPSPAPLQRLPAAQKQPDPSPGRPEFSNFIALPTDRDLERKLEAIRDYIQSGDFREVTQALQSILDNPQDCFLPLRRRAGGKETVAWVSARSEANRLLGRLPAKGRETYEVLSGGRAGSLLKDAKQKGDAEGLAEVVRKYLHTRAGAEAAELLGTHHLDRGRYIMAAACFSQLLDRQDLPGTTLFKAALALRRNDDQAGADRAWKRLAGLAADGLLLGNHRVALDDLRKILEQQPAAAPSLSAAGDCLMFRGDSSRSASPHRYAGEFQLPSQLKNSWQKPTVLETTSRSWLDSATQQLQLRGQASLPGFFPVTVAGKVIFRGHWGIHAVNLDNGELAWDSQLHGGFDHPVQIASPHANLHSQMSSWVTTFQQNSPSMLLENTSLGTLSSDGTRVFVVEDLAVPPYVFNPYYGNVMVIGAAGFNGNNPKEAEHRHNHLAGFDLDSGKIAWVVGQQNEGPFQDTIFLGPPLPLGGKLYSLAEKDQELRLLCLDPRDGRLLWSQPLAQFKKNIHMEVGRRTWAAPLAHAEGILLCPTNSGAVVAVDLLTRSLLWAHAYLQAPPSPEPQKIMVNGRVRIMGMRTPFVPRLTANWKNSAPIISQGKVLLTAPDANELHCLNLRDGSLLWKAPWNAGDLYLADVYKDKVLIVGKQTCRALQLQSGQPLWSTATALPSGQGVLAGSRYLLPLGGSPGTEAAILSLNLDNGQASGRLPLPRQEPLGNLLVYRGRIISQSAASLTVLAPAEKENR